MQDGLARLVSRIKVEMKASLNGMDVELANLGNPVTGCADCAGVGEGVP